MRKFLLLSTLMLTLSTVSTAQFKLDKFGKGFKVLGKDSSFYVKAGFRFQNLHTSGWTLENDEFGSATDYEGAFLIRRSRFKFDGWAIDPKIKFKFEVALSNRDHASGQIPESRNTANMVLDASLEYNFYKNWTILFGQRKLPGNRERVVSSGNLQFVDRSRLNSRFNIDRDMGLQLKHKFDVGQGIMKQVVAFSQGEGRNITEGHFGGYEYTLRAEYLPFGEFQSKGDYVGSAVKREESPKLAIGLTYDINQSSVRERGNLGSFIRDADEAFFEDDEGNFIKDSNGSYVGRDLNTFFADLMFKYQGLSIMMEYADKKAMDNDPFVFSQIEGFEDVLIGTFYTGTGLNIQAGYMLPSNYEIAARYTDINPDEGVSRNEDHYTLGFSKFIVGHKLKLQSDFSLIQLEERDDEFMFRFQMDVHF